jgi:hypothetical protein
LCDRFWAWTWLDPLELLWAVVLEPEEEDELSVAALAIAAPPPAMTPRTTSVVRAFRALLMCVHLLCSFAHERQ